MKGYPRYFSKVVYVVIALLTLSGMALLPAVIDLHLDMEVPWRASGAQHVWLAALHTSSGLIFMMVFGALWSIHMRAGWRRQRHVISGGALTLTASFLAITGVGILYCGHQSLSWWSSALHSLFGLLAVPGFIAHRLLARPRPKKMPGITSRHSTSALEPSPYKS